MQHMLVIGNPARRRGRRRKARRSPSPAQRAARARFAAMARARSKSSRRHRRGSRRVVHANPIFRRRRHVRRVRRNPIVLGGMFRGVVPAMMNAAAGAGGAILNDVAYGFASMVLPAAAVSPISQSGGLNPFYYAGKTASALALGVVGKMLVGRHAVPMMEGALTVTFHDAMKQFLVGTGLPVPLAGSRYNAARVVPPMPMQHNLRRYVGPAPLARASLEAYVKPSAREAVRR